MSEYDADIFDENTDVQVFTDEQLDRIEELAKQEKERRGIGKPDFKAMSAIQLERYLAGVK